MCRLIYQSKAKLNDTTSTFLPFPIFRRSVSIPRAEERVRPLTDVSFWCLRQTADRDRAPLDRWTWTNVIFLSENFFHNICACRKLCHLIRRAILKPVLPSGHYMYHQLTLNNSTFSSHSVFLGFVWISEQTAIISLYSINWLVCITETECVYCAIRTGSLYTILRSAHTAYLCVSCGSENKQRLFTYITLTDWFV